MKLPNPYACDNCKRQKQDTNRWWLFWLDIAKGSDVVRGAHILHWEDGDPSLDQIKHLCSNNCLHEWISKTIL